MSCSNLLWLVLLGVQTGTTEPWFYLDNKEISYSQKSIQVSVAKDLFERCYSDFKERFFPLKDQIWRSDNSVVQQLPCVCIALAATSPSESRSTESFTVTPLPKCLQKLNLWWGRSFAIASRKLWLALFKEQTWKQAVKLGPSVAVLQPRTQRPPSAFGDHALSSLAFIWDLLLVLFSHRTGMVPCDLCLPSVKEFIPFRGGKNIHSYRDGSEKQRLRF